MTKTPRAICVLGPHRSGTSTITRALNLLGVFLGKEKDLMQPLPENPEGFWERLDVYYLQDRILATLKRSWDATVPLPENWIKKAEIRQLRQELVDLVRMNFTGQSLWAWKDPRTCLLLPLWKEVLAELGIGLKVVFVVRNPLDVARSLEKRNGFTLDKGFALWFNNTISALKDMEGLEPIFLSYDRFLDDWEAELKRCAAGLNIVWPADEVGLRAQMAPFVRRDLRHSVSGVDELHEVAAPGPVIRLYSLLSAIMQGSIALRDAEKSIADLHQEFCSYARLFAFDIEALADSRCLLEASTISVESLPAFVEMKKELDERTQWARKLNNEVKVLREQATTTGGCAVSPLTRLRRLVSAFFTLFRNDKGEDA